jgi:hypothetical protein
MKTQQGGYRHKARFSPETCVLQDSPDEGHRLQGRPLGDATVPLFQSNHATNQTRVSKPLREGLATAFRARNHQTATGSSLKGAKSAMLKNRSTESAHVSVTQPMTSKPIGRPKATMQGQPKKRTLPHA